MFHKKDKIFMRILYIMSLETALQCREASNNVYTHTNTICAAMVVPRRLGSLSLSRFSSAFLAATASQKDIPDREEVATEEDEASAVAAVWLIGF